MTECLPSGQGFLLLTNWLTAAQQFFLVRTENGSAGPQGASSSMGVTTPFFTRSVAASATSQTIDCTRQVKVTIAGGTLTGSETLTVGTASANPGLRVPLGMVGGTIYELSLGSLHELDVPLTIELPYDPARVRSDVAVSNAVTIASWSAEENVWSVLPCVVDEQRKVLIFQTTHLSFFEPIYVLTGYATYHPSNGRFKIVYDPKVNGTIGSTTVAAPSLAELVATQMEEAYHIYTNSFTAPLTPIWLFVDKKYSEAAWKGISGDIVVPVVFKGTNDLRVSLGHELFHAVQNRYYNVFAAGSGNRVWWHEACAQYAGQTLIAGNPAPFDVSAALGEEYFKDDFLMYPLTFKDEIHEYGTANFLDFVFQETMGKVSFKGQFDALETYTVTASLLNRFETHVQTQSGQSLQRLYRAFAADVAFNTNGYAPNYSPRSGVSSGIKPTLSMPPDVIEHTYSFALPAGYSARLLAFKVDPAPGKPERQYRIRIQDPDPKVVLDVFRLPDSLQKAARPLPVHSSESFAAQSGMMALAFPTLSRGEYLAFIGSNARTDRDAVLTFRVETAIELKVELSVQSLNDTTYEASARVIGGFPPYQVSWSYSPSGGSDGAEYKQGNPARFTRYDFGQPYPTAALWATVFDSRGNRGEASLEWVAGP